MTASTDIERRWLAPTWFLDANSPEVAAYAAEAVGDATDPTEKAVRLFYTVRDGLRYDPYGMSMDRDDFRAGHIAGLDSAWCVTKSILLTAAARNQGLCSTEPETFGPAFDAMIAFADSQGWLDASGSHVRAHIERAN